VVTPASAFLKDFVHHLGQRADAIRTGQVDSCIDNMLKVTNDGRLAALDVRLVGGPYVEGGKIDRLVDEVVAHYREGDPWRATQLVFCDLATPKGTDKSAA
jgi:hypothetical protein